MRGTTAGPPRPVHRACVRRASRRSAVSRTSRVTTVVSERRASCRRPSCGPWGHPNAAGECTDFRSPGRAAIRCCNGTGTRGRARRLVGARQKPCASRAFC